MKALCSQLERCLCRCYISPILYQPYNPYHQKRAINLTDEMASHIREQLLLRLGYIDDDVALALRRTK
jgi:hypothetical protein